MNVVLIDDNQINLTLLQHLVGRLEDCRAIPFLDPREGLAWCQERDPDLVVVDYLMPAMDGLEFIRRFREQPTGADVPVLMITASDERQVRYRALEFGYSDFLGRPVDRHEFLARSRNLLALRRSQRQLAGRAEWLAQEVERATGEILTRERELILCLSRAAASHDPDNSAHNLRMAHYARLIARRMNLDEEQQDLLFAAAPMHDVGKVATPEHILLKPGRLSREEFEIIKEHADRGYEILQGSPSPTLQAAAAIALTHHEKWDGTGYPRGLRGEEIPLFGRIVAVADVFDALTSERPYKPAWPVERAREVLQSGAGQHFDPACVEAFLADWDQVLNIHLRYRDPP